MLRREQREMLSNIREHLQDLEREADSLGAIQNVNGLVDAAEKLHDHAKLVASLVYDLRISLAYRLSKPEVTSDGGHSK